MAVSEVVLDDLKRRAREAAAHAYAPYSGFAVGAAVLTDGVLAEFGADAIIICCTDDDSREQRFSLAELLPAAFGPASL